MHGPCSMACCADNLERRVCSFGSLMLQCKFSTAPGSVRGCSSYSRILPRALLNQGAILQCLQVWCLTQLCAFGIEGQNGLQRLERLRLCREVLVALLGCHSDHRGVCCVECNWTCFCMHNDPAAETLHKEEQYVAEIVQFTCWSACAAMPARQQRAYKQRASLYTLEVMSG